MIRRPLIILRPGFSASHGPLRARARSVLLTLYSFVRSLARSFVPGWVCVSSIRSLLGTAHLLSTVAGHRHIFVVRQSSHHSAFPLLFETKCSVPWIIVLPLVPAVCSVDPPLGSRKSSIFPSALCSNLLVSIAGSVVFALNSAGRVSKKGHSWYRLAGCL